VCGLIVTILGVVVVLGTGVSEGIGILLLGGVSGTSLLEVRGILDGTTNAGTATSGVSSLITISGAVRAATELMNDGLGELTECGDEGLNVLGVRHVHASLEALQEA